MNVSLEGDAAGASVAKVYNKNDKWETYTLAKLSEGQRGEDGDIVLSLADVDLMELGLDAVRIHFFDG